MNISRNIVIIIKTHFIPKSKNVQIAIVKIGLNIQ